MRTIGLTAALIAVFGLTATAQASGADQMRRSVEVELASFYPEIDVAALNDSQVARIYVILHNDQRHSSKRNKIRAAAGKCLFGCITFGFGN